MQRHGAADCFEVVMAEGGPVIGRALLGPWSAHAALKCLATPGGLCCLGEDHVLRCWGTLDSATPLWQESEVLDFSIGELARHCYIKTTGTVRCLDESGGAMVAVPFEAPQRASHLAQGALTVCAVLEDGAVVCWGTRPSAFLALAALPHGRTTLPSGAFQIPFLSGVRSLLMGENFACATLSSGRVRCWGYELRDHFTPCGPFDIDAINGDSAAARLAQ